MVTLNNNFSLIVISELKNFNHNSFFWYLLLLSGDINLNPGPSQFPLYDSNIWNPFDQRGLHILHLKMNSLLNKIDEMRYIAKASNAAIIGITVTKLYDSVTAS